ncbi:MAG: hypothetical protein OXH00_11440 [Candidatus Poribacteria bacterium]|nr:hypothetical protein [Candidatus Poribacteria bacterium]
MKKLIFSAIILSLPFINNWVKNLKLPPIGWKYIRSASLESE